MKKNAQLIDFTIPLDETLLDASAKIQKNSARAVVVVDREQAVGIISEGDIMRALLRGNTIHSRMEGCVQKSFKYLTTSDPKAAWDLVKTHGISLVPVLGAGFRLVDIYSAQELYDFLTFN